MHVLHYLSASVLDIFQAVRFSTEALFQSGKIQRDRERIHVRPPSPMASRLRLAEHIKTLRGDEEAGSFIARAGISRTDLTRLETAARRPDHNKVMKCLQAASVPEDSEKWRTLLRVCYAANEPGWWDQREFNGMSERHKQVANIESGTEWMGWYHNALMPGPLQTPEYGAARNAALIRGGLGPSSADAQAKGRLRRQQELLREDGPQIEVILEEVVIRRSSVDAATMVAQLEHILELLRKLPQLSIRILPVECEIPLGNVPRAPLSLYRFHDADDGMIAFVETVDKDLLFYDPKPELPAGAQDAGQANAPSDASPVARYVHLFTTMRDVALSREASVTFISKHAAKMAGRVVPQKGPQYA